VPKPINALIGDPCVTKTRRHEEKGLSHDDSLQAVPQHRYVEVHEQSDRKFRHVQVAENLGVVKRNQVFYGLDLQDQAPVDDDVQTLMAQKVASVGGGVVFLALELDLVGGQFQTHGTQIDTFEEPWPEGAMDRDAAANRPVHEILELV
jgi:hypothetical protein